MKGKQHADNLHVLPLLEMCKEMSSGKLNKMTFQLFIEVKIYSQPERMRPMLGPKNFRILTRPSAILHSSYS